MMLLMTRPALETTLLLLGFLWVQMILIRHIGSWMSWDAVAASHTLLAIGTFIPLHNVVL
jgi:hypothetical protein